MIGITFNQPMFAGVTDMHLLSARRQWSLLAILCCIFLYTGCGQQNDPAPSAAPAPETRAAIQAALIDDAGVEVEQFRNLAMSDAPPSAESFDSVSLTLALLLASPWQLDESPERLRQDIAFQSDGPPNPAKIAETLMKNVKGSQCCVIAPNKIQELNCNVSGNTATGNVKFQFGEIFTANVQYLAEQKDGKWRITEFNLPNWDIKLKRGGKDQWIVSGLGVNRLPLRLPRVAGLPARDPAAPRFRVNLGLNPKAETYPPAADDVVVFEGNTVTKLDDYLKKFPAAIKTFTSQRQMAAEQIAVLLWVDRRAAWGSVQKLMQAAAQAGINDVRLAGESESPLQSPNELISIGEFQLLLPQTSAKAEPRALEEPVDTEQTLPRSLRIQANPEGEIAAIYVDDRKFSAAEFPTELKRMAAFSDNKLLFGGFLTDPTLRYENFLKVLSAMGELQGSEHSQVKKFVPFYKTSPTGSPREETLLDMRIDSNLDPARETISESVLKLESETSGEPNSPADSNVTPGIEGKSLPELNLDGIPNSDGVTGGTGIGLSGRLKKPRPATAPKKSP